MPECHQCGSSEPSVRHSYYSTPRGQWAITIRAYCQNCRPVSNGNMLKNHWTGVPPVIPLPGPVNLMGEKHKPSSLDNV